MRKTLSMVCQALQGQRTEVETMMTDFEEKVHRALKDTPHAELHGPVITFSVGGLTYVGQAILTTEGPKRAREPVNQPRSRREGGSTKGAAEREV